MTYANEIAGLRTQLREVNMEFSALVRHQDADDCVARLEQLKVRRAALMAMIANTSSEIRHTGKPLENAAARAA